MLIYLSCIYNYKYHLNPTIQEKLRTTYKRNQTKKLDTILGKNKKNILLTTIHETTSIESVER